MLTSKWYIPIIYWFKNSHITVILTFFFTSTIPWLKGMIPWFQVMVPWNQGMVPLKPYPEIRVLVWVLCYHCWGDYCCIFIWLFVPNFQFPQPVPSAAQLIPLQASLILFLPLHNVLCLMTCFFLWRVLLVLGRKLIFLEVRCQDSCFDLDAV